MKKSLLALLIALVLCLAVMLTGCGDEEESGIKTGEEITPLTITLYSITNDSTTPEQIALVEEAFNNVTQAKYNTNVVLKLYKESEYNDVVRELLKKNYELNETGELVFTKQELGVGEYPSVRDNQIDIFLVNSIDTYYEWAKAEHISPIDEELTNTASLLKSYIYPYNLTAAKIDGETFGVFNNTIYGGYQYLLLNKELVDKEMYDPETMVSVSTISSFLRDVKAKYNDVIPFLGDIEAPVLSWTGSESLLGSFVGDDMTSTGFLDAKSVKPTAHDITSLLEIPEFVSWAKKYNTLYNEGCLVEKTDANKNAKFAATIIEGDVTLSPQFADVYGKYKVDETNGFKYTTIDGVDYYVSVYRRPMATNENVFNAGYCVSKYTENLSRCMEIITCLNTDAELSNIFMYGVKDVHFTEDEETGIVTKITDTYSMDIKNIGNFYLLKQSSDMDEYWKMMSDDNWQNAKNTNREATVSSNLGFYYLAEEITEAMVEEWNMEIAEYNETHEDNPKPYFEFTELSYQEAMDIVKEKTAADYRAILTYQKTDGKDLEKFIEEMKEKYDVKLLEDGKTEEAEAFYALWSETGIYCINKQYTTWHSEAFPTTPDKAE